MNAHVSQELRELSANISRHANAVIEANRVGVPVLPVLQKLADTALLLRTKLNHRAVSHGELRFVLRELLKATANCLDMFIRQLPAVGSCVVPRAKHWAWIRPCTQLMNFCTELVNYSDYDQQYRGVSSIIGKGFIKAASDALDEIMKTKGLLIIGGHKKPGDFASGRAPIFLGENDSEELDAVPDASPKPRSVSAWSRGAKFVSNMPNHPRRFNDELCRACLTGNLLIVASYVTGGHDIHGQNRYGITPLEAAIIGNQAVVVNVLVNAGVQVSGTCPPSGLPPLYQAIERGSIRAASALVDRGARLNPKNIFGKHYFVQICKTQNFDGTQFLLRRGAHPGATDIMGTPMLVWAAQVDNFGICEQLLRYGAGPDATDKLGRSALYWAAVKQNTPLIHLLISRGAEPNTKTPGGSTVLNDSINNQRFDSVRVLLDNGAYGNHTTLMGEPMLVSLMRNGHLNFDQKADMITKLIENGSSPDYTTALWRKPIINYALDMGYPEFVAIFLSHGARYDVKLNGGDTLLCRLVREGNEAAVRALLVRGVDINAPNEEGEKPIMVAIKANDIEMVRLLAECGASMDLAAMQAARQTRAGRRRPILDVLRHNMGRAASLILN